MPPTVVSAGEQLKESQKESGGAPAADIAGNPHPGKVCPTGDEGGALGDQTAVHEFKVEGTHATNGDIVPEQPTGSTKGDILREEPEERTESDVGKVVVLGGFTVVYRTDDVLGSGGYGEIFKGFSPTSNTPCAVKRTRVQSEAAQQAAATLAECRWMDHEHVIGTMASGWHDGWVWHIMPVANGRLMEVCGKLPFQVLCSYASKVASGVAYLHERGWVHRDLKPSNILLVDDAPKICDIDGMLPRGSVSNSTTWTWLYASPEVALNRAGTPLTEDTPRDVWAMGILCYELLLRRLPTPLSSSQLEVVTQSRRGRGMLGMARQRMSDMPTDERVGHCFWALLGTGRLIPSVGVEEVGEPVKRLIDGCFHAEPARRCSAADLRDGFAAVAAATTHIGDATPTHVPVGEDDAAPPP